MSEIVARTGWPCSPNTSQNVTGQPAKAGTGRPSFSSRAFSFSLGAPDFAIPLRSPFTSARKTGTPMRENCSAMTTVKSSFGSGCSGDTSVSIEDAGSSARSVVPARAMMRGQP